jgi:hypothetical protein
MAIILARRGRPVMKLERTIIEQENYLQRYLDEHPDILPLDQLEAEIRPLVLVREFSTKSGPIDAVAIDENANIYLIETKLYKNPDKRLVLAQVLDYGAALWKRYSDPDDFISELDSKMQERTGKGLLQRIAEFYALESEALSAYRENLKSRVVSGQFRFVVLMDTVEDRLKDLISYVNANSRFKILGVGLDFYQHEDIDILIPTLYGAETVPPPPPPGSQVWSEDRFFADASARLTADQLQAIRSLFEWAKTNSDNHDPSSGRGGIGSFNPKVAAVSRRSIFTARTDGTLTLNFGWPNEPESGKAWSDLFGRSLQKEGFSIPAEFSEHFVTLPNAQWVPRVKDLLRILSTSVATARKAAEDLGHES